MDTPQTALCAMASVEASHHQGSQPDATGLERGAGMDLGDQRAWSLVERWSQPHERSYTQALV